ncbi:helix-turn-helix domain-containing protein [Helicobacter pylori]|uniref:helix-turn-helix domain-containing protein n=1 Tax=Helicobacter pylori TaxID=210 RepID=UPI0027141D69|nr:helix-turn-helix domain-containing protein [Helicobacter pylori]MDO7817456.1 helix-turn-helix domain-containing protein [Helicobacter pylori]MDO7823703.1 helix-turn-helix domain-containing protein [Helicobacter pylori]
MESKINRLSAKIDALLEQQKRVISLLETYLSVYPAQEASNKFFKGVSQGMELAPEIAQEDEEKRLYVLQYLSHVDITKNKQDSQLKKDCLEFIQRFNIIPKPLIITALYNLKGIKPTKKEVAKQLQKLYVWERRYQQGGIDALKDRRGRPLKKP